MLIIKQRKSPPSDIAKRHYARIYQINIPGLKMALAIFSAFFLCLLIYCCIMQYSETTLAQGVIINAKGDVQVRAKISGTITDIAVKEGQYVKANQILFSLSQDYGGKEGSVIEYEAGRYIDEKKRNQDRILNISHSIENLKDNLANQLTAIDGQIAVSAIKIKKAKQLAKNAEQTYHSYQSIEKKGYVSKTELAQRKNDMLNAQLNIKLQESDLLQLQSNKSVMSSNAQSQRDDLTSQILQLNNRNNEIERTLAIQGSKSLTMLAPTDGMVVAINLPPGTAVTQDSEVVVVIRQNTASPLEGYLYIPSNGAGRIKPGDKVQVRFDAWPVDKYGTIETTLEDFYPVNVDTRSALIPLKQGQTYYLARVKLPPSFKDPWQQTRMLSGGMTLNADIMVDKRPLIALLLAPLERARQRFLS